VLVGLISKLLKYDLEIDMTENNPVSNKMLTPLWVISLFISLAEVITTIAATQTSGVIQIALTVFAIFFPILIAIGFFLLLWKKPHHLYAPAEYSGQVGVREYIEAITRQQSIDEDKLYETIHDSVHSNLTSPEMVAEITNLVTKKSSQYIEREITSILDNIANKTIDLIREESFITVDPSPMIADKEITWKMNYSKYPHVSAFLDEVFFRITDLINLPTYNYGQLWVLRDKATGKIFSQLGSNWPPAKGVNLDVRRLQEVGLMPGMELEAIFLK
jgi:hypothetical protein